MRTSRLTSTRSKRVFVAWTWGFYDVKRNKNKSRDILDLAP